MEYAAGPSEAEAGPMTRQYASSAASSSADDRQRGVEVRVARQEREVVPAQLVDVAVHARARKGRAP